MLDSIGGRKVLVVAGAVLLGVLLVLWKGDVPANFLTLMQWALPLFMAGNAVEHTARAVIARSAAPDPVTAPPAPVDATQVSQAVSEAVSKDLKPLIQGVVNQNVVLSQIAGDSAKGITYLVGYVQQTQGPPRA